MKHFFFFKKTETEHVAYNGRAEDTVRGLVYRGCRVYWQLQALAPQLVSTQIKNKICKILLQF